MKRLLSLIAPLATSSMAFGAYFYNGDFAGDSASANTIGGTRAFDEVQVMDPVVTQIWANMAQYGQNLANVSAYEYQFRQGVGFQNGGTIVASGTVSSAQVIKTATGRFFDTATPEFQVLINVNIDLQPGTYFLSIAAVGSTSDNVVVVGTDGNDYGPSTDPNPIPVNQILNNTHWDVFNSGSGGADPGTGDLSYGVASSPVPEPATLALTGLGVVALMRRLSRTA